MIRVLVTGRTGQVVSSLVERAGELPDVDIVTLGRPELDMTELDGIGPAIVSHSPDVVINAAAYTAVDQAEDEPGLAFLINAAAAERVAAATRSIGARLVQISTDYVYEGSASEPYTEDIPTDPRNVYGRSKREGELRVLAAQPEATIVRTAWVHSPYGRNFVKTMLQLAVGRDEVSVVGDQHGNPTSALDLADALVALVRGWAGGQRVGLGEVYHVAGTGDATWVDLARTVFDEAAACGRPSARVRTITTTDYPTRATRPANSRLDCGKFQRDVGFNMPGWESAARQVVRQIIEQTPES